MECPTRNLQKMAHARKVAIPVYVDSPVPENSGKPQWESCVTVFGQSFKGQGESIKAAKRKAAALALKNIGPQERQDEQQREREVEEREKKVEEREKNLMKGSEGSEYATLITNMREMMRSVNK